MPTDLRARLKSCRGVLADSNTLLDIATKDPVWADWSAKALAELVEQATVVIHPIIYAEASLGFSTIEALDTALPSALYRRAPLPWEAAFLAGNALFDTAAEGDRAVRRCLIFTLARTRPSAV